MDGSRSRLGWVMSACAVAGLGFAAERIGDVATGVWVPDLLVGVALAVCGVIAGWSSGRVTGVMLLGAGTTWYLANLSVVLGPDLAALATQLSYVHRGLVAVAAVGLASSIRSMASVAVAALVIASAAWPPIQVDRAGMAVWGLVVVAGLGATLGRASTQPWPWASLVALGSTLAATAATAGRPALSLHVYESGIVLTGLLTTMGAYAAVVRSRRLGEAVADAWLGPATYVREQLVRALGDDGVAVAFATSTGWMDELGRDCEPLPVAPGRALVRVYDGTAVAAVVSCRTELAHQPGVVDSLRLATRLAARNARLRASLRARASEVERSRLRLLVTADEQRRQLGFLLEHATRDPLDRLDDELDAVGRAEAARSLRRDLTALAAGLGPAALERGDLRAAVEQLVTGVPMRVGVSVEVPTLGRELASAAYFVVAEAVTNAVKHAGATSLEIEASEESETLVLRVADDGSGGASYDAGSGLRGLADRIAAFGGDLLVTSNAGTGTEVVVTLPVTGAPGQAGPIRSQVSA
ncbi:MAG: ATP-binding protein [Nocardioides sp.]